MKVAIALVSATIAATIAAQTPARDTPLAAATGRAAVAGTVVADDEARTPMRRAVVTLSRAGVNDSRLVATDDSGRYRFDELPPGVYTMSASKGGYLGASYGAAEPGLPGNPIPISSDQQFSAAPLVLVRGAVITGRLTDLQGHPIQFSNVFATQFRDVNGDRRRRGGGASSRNAATDAHGTYRIFGLLPGEYIVSATALEALAGGSRQETSPADVEWAQQQLRAGAPAPIAPSPPGGLSGTAPGRAHVYAATYFPGTADPTGARTITLGRGEERSGLDFQMQEVPVIRVTGTVLAQDGQPVPNAAVVRVFKTSTPLLVTQVATAFDRANQAGVFSLSGVVPGDYTLTVRAAPPDGPAARQTLWGAVDISATGDDITNLAIRLQPGMTVTGTVAFEGAPPTPAELKAIQLRLVAAPGSPVSFNLPPVALSSSLTFGFEGVPASRYLMSVAISSGSRWAVKSAVAGGTNALDLPFDIRPGENVSGLIVTLSDRQAALSGTLVDAMGQPTPQFYLLVFPTDRRFWTPESRWIRSTRADITGAYRIGGLPAGEYYLCAVTELDTTQQFEPDYLERLIPAAITLTLKDGEQRAQALRVGGR